MHFGNVKYLASLSGIFRLLTVICGFPAVILAWVAYFSSSWTKEFPEIQTILEAGSIRNSTEGEDGLISDEEEEYLDKILFQTLMYEKFFIGFVTVVFIISISYLIIRVLHKPLLEESPYEIIFDFLFHVLSALGLLTGSALILLSAAKIESFIDQIDDDFPPAIVEIINKDRELQDKSDKIAAGILGMLNGILYALCVVTLRMVQPLECKKKRKVNDIPRFSVLSVDIVESRKSSFASRRNSAFELE